MTLSESRLTRMAQVLVRYSLAVQPGQLVAVMAGVAAMGRRDRCRSLTGNPLVAEEPS